MPYLKKAKRRVGSTTRRKTDTREARQSIYRTERWKRLRHGYLMHHPVCELCDARGIVTLAVDVHHRRSFQVDVGAQRLFYAYNAGNLMALCKACHAFIHRHGATYYTDTDTEAAAADEAFGKGVPPHKYI